MARFKLVLKTNGNPIIFLDDDENIEPDFVEYNFQQYKKFGSDCILGWWTKIFNKESYWVSLKGLPYGTEVDYVGTGGMIIDRRIFEKEPLLQNIPENLRRAEDLYLCYLARMKYRMKLISIEKKCSIEVDKKDQYYDIIFYKEKAFQFLRNKGWRLLIDSKNADS